MPLDATRLSGTIYLPDTSSLIENPDALDRLLTDGNIVVLAHQVIEELGRLQSNRNKSDGIRGAARAANRKILEHRAQGRICHDLARLLAADRPADVATPTPQGGVLAWEPAGPTSAPFDSITGDNLIVASARRVQDIAGNDARYEVVIVSEDGNLLLKCDALGLRGENLRYGKVEIADPSEIYRGYVELDVDEGLLDAFLESGEPYERKLPFSALPSESLRELVWNTGVVLRSESRTLLARANIETNAIQDLRYAQYWDRKRGGYAPRPLLGMTARDPLQTLALEFLLDPSVQLVVLDGPAGSGKTRLMVAAALEMIFGPPTSVRFSGRSSLVHQNPYDNGMFLLRPEHPSSKYELGFLPGDLDQKISPWLEPFMQHMRSLSALNEHDFVGALDQGGLLHMLSSAMLRGLDIERAVVLVDELQNGDRHFAKTLMSRFCDSSKVVLAGCLDPVQIDNPYVDWRSNALTRVKQTYRGFGPVVAQVTLVHNYRGPISKKADDL